MQWRPPTHCGCGGGGVSTGCHFGTKGSEGVSDIALGLSIGRGTPQSRERKRKKEKETTFRRNGTGDPEVPRVPSNVLCYFIQSYLVLSYLTLSQLILSYPNFAYLISHLIILSCLAFLDCLIFSFLILFWLIFSFYLI